MANIKRKKAHLVASSLAGPERDKCLETSNLKSNYRKLEIQKQVGNSRVYQKKV